ncbi:hypothetical protein B0H11DRAFT_2012962 [Mycena galericulata]|nr:hypothetical protein B0H11DRAFT_2012962 [Mycena galericulata]
MVPSESIPVYRRRTQPVQPRTTMVTRSSAALRAKLASTAIHPDISGSKSAHGKSESSGDRSGAKAPMPYALARSRQRLNAIDKGSPSRESEEPSTPARPRDQQPRPSLGMIRIPAQVKKTKIPWPSNRKVEVLLSPRRLATFHAGPSNSHRIPSPKPSRAHGKRKASPSLPEPSVKRVTRRSNANDSSAIDIYKLNRGREAHDGKDRSSPARLPSMNQAKSTPK